MMPGALLQKLSLSACLMFLSFLSPVCVFSTEAGIVAPGDEISIRFTCALKDGAWVASSDVPSFEQSKIFVLSNIYVPRTKSSPLVIRAGEGPEETVKERSFEEEILDRLARMVVGKHTQETFSVELTAQNDPRRDAANYVLTLARVRTRPREMRMTSDAIRARTGGRDPMAGEAFTIDPDFPGRIETVSDREVVVRFSPKAPGPVDTPFGPGTVETQDDAYKVILQAEPGRLVRTGPMVGRIVEVTPEIITIDYRHPFGGEVLNCECTVLEIQENPSAKAGSPIPVHKK